MKYEQSKYIDGKWHNSRLELKDKAQIVFAFGSTSLLKDEKIFTDVRSLYPSAHLLFCSTAGEIIDTAVLDNSVVLMAVYFEKTHIEFAETDIESATESFDSGKKLTESLEKADLVHVMVFSDGLKVNGTELVKGLLSNLPANVAVTGGLVADGANFKETYVGLDKKPSQGKIVVLGFYGKSLKVGYGSLGGWDNFGPQRMITKSKGNILYELDHQPALKLYKSYLGEKTQGLPSTGLLFPLSLHIKTKDTDAEIVRTILGVNESEQSMTFAGDMPQGVYAKLMRANFERLIDGASGAASMSTENLKSSNPDIAILVSCIGRKLVLKERIEEEIEAVRDVVGQKAGIIGFYSYGELCPTAATQKQCQLHNQTMTITTFRE